MPSALDKWWEGKTPEQKKQIDRRATRLNPNRDIGPKRGRKQRQRSGGRTSAQTQSNIDRGRRHYEHSRKPEGTSGGLTT